MADKWTGKRVKAGALTPDGKQVWEVVALTPDVCNLYDVTDNLIVPATRAAECSYVELIAEGPQPATVFVSHYWGEPVLSFVECLRQFTLDYSREPDEPAACFWVCAYANNQHKLNEEIKTELEGTSFHKAIASSGRTVAIVGHGEVFTRSWCVYEMWLTFVYVGHAYDAYSWDPVKRLAHGLNAGPSAADKAIAVETGVKDPALIKAFREERFPSAVLAAAEDFEVAKAEASKEQDRDRILLEIETREGGRELVQDTIAAHYCMSLIGAALRSRDGVRLAALLKQVASSRLRSFHVACEGRRAAIGSTAFLVSSLPPTLERLTLVGMAPVVAPLLRAWRGAGLRELSLASCALGDAAAETIASITLSKWPQLAQLDLSVNRITSRGARALADMLPKHESLRALDVSNNWISDGGVRALARGALARRDADAQVRVQDNMMLCGRRWLSAEEVARVPDLVGSAQFWATLLSYSIGVAVVFIALLIVKIHLHYGFAHLHPYICDPAFSDCGHALGSNLGMCALFVLVVLGGFSYAYVIPTIDASSRRCAILDQILMKLRTNPVMTAVANRVGLTRAAERFRRLPVRSVKRRAIGFAARLALALALTSYVLVIHFAPYSNVIYIMFQYVANYGRLPAWVWSLNFEYVDSNLGVGLGDLVWDGRAGFFLFSNLLECTLRYAL